jgi:hypothetical protein
MAERGGAAAWITGVAASAINAVVVVLAMTSISKMENLRATTMRSRCASGDGDTGSTNGGTTLNSLTGSGTTFQGFICVVVVGVHGGSR